MKFFMNPSRDAAALGCCAMLLTACGGNSTGTGGDMQSPTATLTAPVDLTIGLTGLLSLTAAASDNVAVTGVEFQVDGTIVGTEDGTAPYTRSVDTSAYAAGQHVVRARARDAAGNLSSWSSATVHFASSASVPQGFTKNEGWVSGLSSAKAFAQAPDGRLFIAEKGGALRVVKNGALLLTPFVQLAVDASGERGLLGVTLDPNFAFNQWVYVYYTTTEVSTHNRVSRFTANNDVASVGSEVRLVDLPALSSATNRNGGALHFGVDGKLYVGVGDNASSAKSPDLTDPFGKMLRLNSDGTIPNDNPFCATAGQLKCAIWARGLRDPSTFAVQPGTGFIHINDVGQDTWEEVNLGAAGANYGWPTSQGPDNVGAGMTAPLFAFKHSDAVPPGSGLGGFFTGLVISGGVFYPDSGTFPASYNGNYFFANYFPGWIGRLDPANGNAAYAFANLLDTPVDMLVGTDNALYVLTGSAVTRISAP